MKILLRLLFKLFTKRVELIKVDLNEFKSKNVRFVLIFKDLNASLEDLEDMQKIMSKLLGFEGVVIAKEAELKIVMQDKKEEDIK